MSRWVAEHRKALTVLGLGLLQLAAYVVADPRNLPPWVVSVAVAVNTIGVWWVRNAPQRVSRDDLKAAPRPTTTGGYESLPTRLADPAERPRRQPPPTDFP